MGDEAERLFDAMLDEMLEGHPFEPYLHLCKYCGADYLYWQMTPLGWRLFDYSGKHSCEKYLTEKLLGRIGYKEPDVEDEEERCPYCGERNDNHDLDCPIRKSSDNT